jgi:hypothetical protein
MMVEEARIEHLVDELNAYAGTVIFNASFEGGTVWINNKAILINNKFY